jgi:FKBP-type peptidyl-prolyl cis-trans isomerase FkpA
MIKKLFFLSLVVLLFVSCNKTDVSTGACTYTPSTLKADTGQVTYLRNYLAANSIVATQDTSGYFYHVNAVGTGTYPTICSTVFVQYSGWLIPSGFKFDESTSGTVFRVGAVIEAWQKVLPTMLPGGSDTIYVPPSLGYDSVATGAIPANSYLKFYIKLVAVQ